MTDQPTPVEPDETEITDADLMTPDTPAGPTLIVTQEVQAPASEVYAAWTDRDRLARWWWPGLPDASYDVDARPGGVLQVSSEVATLAATGLFLELDEPSLIAMSWVWEATTPTADDDLVTVEIREHTEGTLVILTHELSDPDGDVSFRDGWVGALGSLAHHLEG